MKIIAFVPIKLKSQRLPNKNIAEFNGKPLFVTILEKLLKVNLFDDIYVFCSDSSIIKFIPNGVKFLKRDASLDSDEVKGFEIWQSFSKVIKADYYFLAHSTAPLIYTSTIFHTVNKILFENHEKYDSAFTVLKYQTFSWYLGKPLNYNLTDVPRTQDIEPVFIETSGFYLFSKEVLQSGKRIGIKPLLVPVTSVEAVDIDYQEDLDFARTLIKTNPLEIEK